MDDTRPRHDGGASAHLPALHQVTVLADADESAAQALDDWSRGLDWVHWLFSGIRQRQPGLYLQAGPLPLPSLYPKAPLTHQALAARWENFVRSDLHGGLGTHLVQAWQAVQEQNLDRLLQLDRELSASLSPENAAASAEAGARLLQGTRGARYQGLLGRYRSLQEEAQTPGHFLIVWACVAHFFQLGLTNVIAEYIRLEWDLAVRHLPGAASSLAPETIASLTASIMHLPQTGLRLLGDDAELPGEEGTPSLLHTH